MRDNGPVTQREVDYPENTRLVSRTDDKGRITFVNAAFVQISGFSEEELTGSPHNIVRHPDMPQEAFADLWATLKSGNPWRGLVKNRTKTGDHYWVRADVMPVIEDGKPAGYVSIRSKPERAEVTEAERIYKLFREGRADGLAIEGGSVVRRKAAWRRWLGSVGGWLTAQTLATLMLLALVAGIGGWSLTVVERAAANAELDRADRIAALSQAAMAGLLVLACVVAVLMARQVRRVAIGPLERMSAHFVAIALRDERHQIPEEEIEEFRHASRMLRAMQGLLGYAAQEKIEIDRRSTARAKADLHTLADTLESRVHSVVEEVGKASGHLADSARVLSKNADVTRQRSQAVQEQAEEVRRNVDSVAAATHELAAAEQEISRQVVNTAEISLTASRQAADTRTAVGNLSQSANRIGEIVAVITEVAGRTNMLALNATIEATRAGDAGKGFAVVAGEVKALAHQTGHATEDISRQIRAIQNETETTVAAINRITTTISEVSEVSSAVAAAVEEQGVATREIARSVNEVALGTQAASENVAVVAQVARETETMAAEVLASADILRDAAHALDREVSDFLAGIRR